MDLLFSDQAQPILIIALVAGLVIGIAATNLIEDIARFYQNRHTG